MLEMGKEREGKVTSAIGTRKERERGARKEKDMG